MTRDDIQRIMDEVPDLNAFGIGVFDEHKKTPEQRVTELEADRRELLDSVEMCNKLCEWLSGVEKRQSINEGHTSYGLKHMAEEDIGYVTNGAFITAAIHCGFPYRIKPGSPNVLFGMSERSLDAIRKRRRE